jgi:predicted Zn-dependent peptidase
MGFHFPSAISPNNPAAEIFNTYLGDGMSSRLFLEVREKLGLAYSIGSFYSSGAGFGHLVAHAGTDKDNVSKTMDIILREIRAARDVSSEKLASIKRQMIGSCLVKTEDSSNSALELVNAEIYGNAEDYYKFPEKLNSVSLDEVRALSVVGDYSSFVLGPN